MLNADADYARVVALLTKQQLAPYVSFNRLQHFTGFGARKSDNDVIVVRVSDGTIVRGTASGIEAGDYHDRSNPVTHPSFDPACYRATNESDTNYDGQPAVKFDLAPVCKSRAVDDVDYPFTTFIAEAGTMKPLDVSGIVKPRDDSKNVTVSLDQKFDTFDGRVLPSRLQVDVVGSGLMFWLNLHVTESYSGYAFTKASP